MTDYLAERRAVDLRTLELRAPRKQAAGALEALHQEQRTGRKRQSGQEIAEEAGLFSTGKRVKQRVGI